MQRRRFVGTVGSLAVTLGLLPVPGGRRRRSAPFDVWTWVHGDADRSPDAWREQFARIREAGVLGVLVSGGDGAMLADAAHRAGLAFHRWIWIVNRPGDSSAQQDHPEWFQVNRNGDSCLDVPPYVDYYKWVCPTREPVRAYLRDLVDRVAREPGVDGVHLDYIRFPDVILPRGLWEKYGLVQDRELPEFDFCYCDVCRETFMRQAGRDPLLLENAPADPLWRRFRWDRVTQLVRLLADTVHAHAKPLSAAVFPTPAIARRLVRQSWDEWPLDLVFPMLYHGFYEEGIDWIGTTTATGVAAVGPGMPLRSGLYLPDLSPNALARAVRVARDAGARGVSLFEMDGLTDQHLTRLREALAG